MDTHAVTVPEIALVGMTRGMAGAGLGLLLGDRLAPDIRRAVGWTLLAVGIVTTVPIVMALVGSRDGTRTAEV